MFKALLACLVLLTAAVPTG